MFRKKKDEPKVTPEEAQRMKAAVIGQNNPQPIAAGQYQQPPVAMQQIAQPQMVQQTQAVQPVNVEGTGYFISRREMKTQRKQIQAKSGQIIETDEIVTDQITTAVYELTDDDLLAILKGVDEKKKISKAALEMLQRKL